MKRTQVITGLAVAAVLLVVGLAVMYHLPLNFRDLSPMQPIAFSHKVHAGKNGINCLFCHRYATRSPDAGIPSMDTCRTCHQYIAQDRPEVKKLMGYWDRKEPVPWVRVYWLPDHVYFPHMMHLRAGLACTQCHGEVASMDRISRVSSLQMGWCLGCHKEKKVSIDCWTCHI
jgi:hypothetical protein